MRHPCEWESAEMNGEPCGKPSVDCWVFKTGSKEWLCAEHWDLRVRARTAVDRILNRLKSDY